MVLTHFANKRLDDCPNFLSVHKMLHAQEEASRGPKTFALHEKLSLKGEDQLPCTTFLTKLLYSLLGPCGVASVLSDND